MYYCNRATSIVPCTFLVRAVKLDQDEINPNTVPPLMGRMAVVLPAQYRSNFRSDTLLSWRGDIFFLVGGGVPVDSEAFAVNFLLI
jgi:hypothetical protein